MDKHFISHLLKGLASTSFGSMLTIGFHFLSILLMTRYVVKDVLGLYFLVLALNAFLTVISGLGLDLTLSKFVAGGDRLPQKETIASTFVLRFISVTFIGLIFYITSQFILPGIDSRLSDSVVIMIALLYLISFRDLFLSLMQGIQQFSQYAIVEVVSAITRAILLVVFRDRLSLQGLLYIEIISQLVEVLLQFYFTRAVLVGLSLSNVKAEAVRSLTRFSTPLYSNNLLTVMYDRGNTFLIGVLLNPASVAAYEVALKIPDGFMRLFNSFIVVYFPSLSKLFAKGDQDEARKMMNNSLIVLSTGIIFLVLVAFLFAHEIVLIMFSKEYLEVSLVFALLMLNFFLRAISNTLGYSLVAAGYSSAPVKTNIVAIIVEIVGSLVMIRMFGYIGAAYSLLLMNITSQILYVRKLRQVGLAPHLFAYLKPVVLLAAILGIYGLFGIDNILLRLLLIALYIAGCWLFINELKGFSRTIVKYVLGLRTRSASVEPARSEDVL